MWLEDLVTYVRSKNVAGLGNNVYLFTLKENDVGAIFTTHTQGVISTPDIPDYYRGQLQVIVRSNNPRQSLSQSQAISDLLSSQQRVKAGIGMGLILPTTEFKFIMPRHLPVVFPRSDGDFYEASTNFDVCFQALY